MSCITGPISRAIQNKHAIPICHLVKITSLICGVASVIFAILHPTSFYLWKSAWTVICLKDCHQIAHNIIENYKKNWDDHAFLKNTLLVGSVVELMKNLE